MFSIRQKHILSKSLRALSMALVIVACSEPRTFIKNKVDNFNVDTIDDYTQASELLQADYLFSVDFSWSMSGGCRPSAYNDCESEKTARLIESMDSFTNSLRSADIDYRIGFVKGSTQSTTNQVASDFINGLVITSAFDSSLTQLIQSRLGPVGEPLEGNATTVVQSAANVLNNNGNSFLRDSAQLVLVFVSDNDDERFTSSDETLLRNIKGDPSYVSARAVLAGVGNTCYKGGSASSGYSYGEEYGAQIEGTVSYLDQGPGSKVACIYNNFSSILDDLARNVTRTTKRFKLQVPNPDTGSIRVYIEDSLVSSTNYSYVSGSNEIVFDNGEEPDPDQSLRIEYEQIYTLSTTPNPDTISVKVNGVSLTESSTNGWTYNSSSNTIEFHGSAKPNDGDKIQVTYKLG